MNRKIETASLQDKVKLEEKIKSILDGADKTIKVDKINFTKVKSRNQSTNNNLEIPNLQRSTINIQNQTQTHDLNKKQSFMSTSNLFNSSNTTTQNKHRKNKSQVSDLKSISTRINKTQMQSDIRENLLSKKEELKCEKNCKNLPILVKYETVIKELMYENEKLKRINQFFMISMGRKDEYLLNLLKENTDLNTEVFLLNKKGEFDHMIFNPSSHREVKTDKNLDVTKNKSNMQIPVVVVNSPSALGSSQKLEIVNPPINPSGLNLISGNSNTIVTPSLQPENNSLRKSGYIQRLAASRTENHTVKEEDEQEHPKNQIPMSKLLAGIVAKTLSKTTSSNQERKSYSGYSDLINNLTRINVTKRKVRGSTTHYEEIIDMFNKKSRKTSIRDTKSSFLTASNQVLSKIMTQDIIKEILKLTNNDDDFLQAMRSFPDDKLIMFSDSIATLIKDYDYSIKLIKRIKSFLQVSIRVVNTMILEDAISMLIKNSCEILDCDRTSIYVHDKLINMLVLHAGEGLKKGEWKIPPDKGIVGYVFTKGDRQKIDDAYLDDRFNKEVDKKTGYRTKSMLCVPLKDEDGTSFGVIQALNKKGGALFSADDEELMDVFANQAGSILKNSMRFDENLSYISRLKMLLNYTMQVNTCSNVSEYTYMGESLLASFWSTNISQILVINDISTNVCYHHRENEVQEKINNIGLIGRVKLKKEMIAINSGYDNPYFNNLVDLESGFSLLTFPIFEHKSETKIIAIGQVGYPFKIPSTTNRPKEIDADVISFFSSIASFWLTNFLSADRVKYDI